MLIDVASVCVRPEFQLDLKFKNGEQGRFDMRPLLLMKPWSRIATPIGHKAIRCFACSLCDQCQC